MFALPGLATAQTAYEQEGQDFDPTGLAESIIVDVLGEEKSADIDQNIEQPVTREISQDVDQSEENEQDNDNTQTQTAAIAQDIEQGLADGDDSAKAEAESGHAKAHKHGRASSSLSSGDAENENEQEAINEARLQQVQVQNLDQDNFEFGDYTADLDAANGAVPIGVGDRREEDGEEEDLIPLCIGPSAQGNQENAETLFLKEEEAADLEEDLPSGQFERGVCEEED